jgi:hypothetical protein
MGFNANNVMHLKASEEKELKNVEEVHNFIQQELKGCVAVDSGLKLELTEIKDMENNLNIILVKLEFIIKIIGAKDKIIKNIFEEVSKPNTDIDLAKCSSLFSMVGRMDQDLNPVLGFVSRQLSKLILPEYHKLYDQSEDLRKQIKEVSGRASKVHAEFNYLCVTSANNDLELNRIRQNLAQIERERLNRVENRLPVGFKLK